MSDGLRVGLVYDLRSEYLAAGYDPLDVAEFDEDITVDSLERAVAACGYRPERIGNARVLCGRLAAGERWDLVFSIAEGIHGRSREAQVPAILELFNIPYVFSDPLVCALTLDKAMAKRVVQSYGLSTPGFRLISSESDLAGMSLQYPLFAKPVAEGTGKGVDGGSLITSPEAMRTTCLRLLSSFKQPVLVEEYLPGREFTTAVLGTGAAMRVLGTLEITILPHAPVRDYTFEVKELCDSYVRYSTPEPGFLRDSLETLALASCRALECRDVARVDIRLDVAGVPSFLEVNPLPGLNPGHSDLPMIASRAGMSYQDLIRSIIDSALVRVQRQKI